MNGSALLPQPGGFEGLVAIPEDPYTHELAAIQFVEVRERLCLAEAAFGLEVKRQPTENAARG
jgi:hypothetical protein